jgi:hypothetical protein
MYALRFNRITSHTLEPFSGEFMDIWMLLVLVSVIGLAVVAIALSIGSIRRYQKVVRAEQRSGEKVKIPASPIQRRAMLSLLITISSLIAITLLLLENGVVNTFDTDTLRHTFTLIVLSVIVINAAMIIPLRSKSNVDERDARIVREAPMFQASAMLTLSAFWAIGLTETFRAQQAIPIEFAYLFFWINTLVYFIAWAMGVLFGYWRMNTYGE